MIYTHTETLGSQTRTASPRGAFSTFGRVTSTLSRAGVAIWHTLEDVGQARANRELRLLADRCAITDPELAHQLRQASKFDATSRGATADKS